MQSLVDGPSTRASRNPGMSGAGSKHGLRTARARRPLCQQLRSEGVGPLGECLADTVHTDYSDLRGTPPETMSRDQFVQLRRSALQELQTHHLAGNLEIELTGG